MAESERTVRVDFNVDDTARSIEALLNRLDGAWPQGPRNLTLDLQECRYLGPAAVCLITALMAEVRSRQGSVRLVPPSYPQLYAYCRYSGLLHAAGIEDVPENAHHPDNVTIATRLFTGFDYQGLEYVTALVRRFIPMSTDTEGALRSSITELMQNVRDHSQSSIGGLLSARAFTEREEVRFVVADLGLGIPEVLKRQHGDLGSDEASVLAAFDERRSSKSQAHNKGLGLPHLSQAIQLNGGAMEILSGHGSARQRDGDPPRPVRLTARFPGTLAIVRFRIDNQRYAGNSSPAEDLEF